MNYYNEFDPKAAAWLRELIKAGLISPGVVDERSIKDVRATDLLGYSQCHFFAGIGGWSYALRVAGWPDDEPVWTMSCPCQPFSGAGKKKGARDERHLWPWARHLIFRCRPATTFGEQVAGPAGLLWLNGVRANLETLGYAVGAADLCAAGVGAPHRRQRLYWVAHTDRRGCDSRSSSQPEQEGGRTFLEHGSIARWVVFANGARRDEGLPAAAPTGYRDTLGSDGNACGLSVAQRSGLEGFARHGRDGHQPGRHDADAPRPATQGSWSSYDILPFRDGKTRRVEPGTFPLAHGVPARVGRLRGYGNAIVPENAQVFIEAWLDINFPSAQCSNGGRTQSGPYPARAVKGEVSARQLNETAKGAARPLGQASARSAAPGEGRTA